MNRGLAGVLAVLLLTMGCSSGRPRRKSVVLSAVDVADDLAAGRHDAIVARFDDTMRSLLTADKLRELTDALRTQVGDFVERSTLQTEEAGGRTVVVVPMRFERAWLNLRVAYDANGRISGLLIQPGSAPGWDAPGYVRTDAFTERNVEIAGPRWRLPGTLTIPEHGLPAPVVVLVHGSGPNDRDESVGGVKVFKDIAWGLASRGIAVLRYDKATRAVPEQVMPYLPALTLDIETSDDAVAAVSLLRTMPGVVDARRIVVAGHSQGAMALGRIGAKDERIAGFVALAGPARSIAQAAFEQTRYILSTRDGVRSAAEQAALAALERQVAVATGPTLSPDTPASDLPLGIPASFWLDVRDYDPPAAARALRRPILVLQGGRDYQVTPDEFDRWKAEFRGVRSARFVLYPALNHLFVTGTGPPRPDEYAESGHVEPDVVADIADFVRSL